eukprot:gene14002-biopygen4002
MNITSWNSGRLPQVHWLLNWPLPTGSSTLASTHSLASMRGDGSSRDLRTRSRTPNAAAPPRPSAAALPPDGAPGRPCSLALPPMGGHRKGAPVAAAYGAYGKM